MGSGFAEELTSRFVRYCEIDSQADEKSPTSPSTAIQLDILRLLVDELTEIGAQDVILTSYGAVTATIPATAGKEGAPVIGFLAHVDTSPGFNASNVKPIVHKNYDGSDITFPDDASLILSPADSPYLGTKVGDDIVTASGTTLLGADDKAGVAIVMAFANHLLHHPEIEHGPIRIGFTPDEEIGRGVHADFPRDLGAQFAYTLDGGPVGEVVYETFSADRAEIHITGVSIHPGQAKDVMVNALHLAAKIIDTLPHITLTPETTDDREGFLHIYSLTGTSAEAELLFIMRDFEEDKLQQSGELLQQVCATIQATEPRAKITCEITPQYRNMRDALKSDFRPVDLALEACRALGIEPFSPPIRGGTDGSRLTELGVPTPNIFTGMMNFHGPLEYVSVQDMEKATEVSIKLAQLWANE
ncbi:MAG: peptidase T [Thermomicrobiales bacterium]|nr:peptidase T [Thermomicrobiales bacterium]